MRSIFIFRILFILFFSISYSFCFCDHIDEDDPSYESKSVQCANDIYGDFILSDHGRIKDKSDYFTINTNFNVLNDDFIVNNNVVYKRYLTDYTETLNSGFKEFPSFLCYVDKNNIPQRCLILKYTEKCFSIVPGLEDVNCGEVQNVFFKHFATCSKNEFFNLKTETCELKSKFPDDKDRPDWCPKPMKYEIDFDKKLKIDRCLPNTDMNREECESKGMHYHDCFDIYDDRQVRACMQYPQGCYAKETYEHYLAEEKLNNDLFIFSGFLPSSTYVISSFKNGLSSLTDFFRNLFKTNPKNKPNLLEYRPEVIDFELTKSGPVLRYYLKRVTPDDIVENFFLKRSDNSETSISQFPQFIIDVSPGLESFGIHNSNRHKNSFFIINKFKKNNIPIPTKEIVDEKTINIPYDFESLFGNKTTGNLPITLNRTGIKDNKSTFKGQIKSPDNSVVDVEVVETDSFGSKIQDITLCIPDSDSGSKIERNYLVIVNKNTGKVDNSTALAI